MDNKEFSKELLKRTIKFAVRIILLSSALPNTPEGRVVRNQITKSGTSIGANFLPYFQTLTLAHFRHFRHFLQCTPSPKIGRYIMSKRFK